MQCMQNFSETPHNGAIAVKKIELLHIKGIAQELGAELCQVVAT